MSRRLTKKQIGFVNDYAETGNGALAARQNYDVLNDETARVIASENLTKPNIIQALEKRGFNTENAKSVVGEILDDATIEPKDRLKAADLVFKVHGDLAPEKHLVVTRRIISIDD